MQPDASGGITPSLTGDELISRIPDLEKVADIELENFRLIPGASLSFQDIQDVANLINNDDTIDGAVIVQGTDTIDETSYLLDLLCSPRIPVIVTGAMRGAAALGADGPSNLLNAVRVAASPQAQGLGALVVLNEEIHAADDVDKGHTGFVSSFQSPNTGPLGYVLEGQIRVLRQPVNPPVTRPFTPTRFPKVALLKFGLDDCPDLPDSALRLGYQGAVVEAMGVGHMPAPLVPALEALAQQIPVVLSTRVNAGPVFTSTYGFPGSEIDLLQRGLIPGGLLSAHKARLLLTVALGSNVSRDTLPALFA